MSKRYLPAILLLAYLLLGGNVRAQDKAIYKKKKVWGKERTVLTVDVSRLKSPHKLDEFHVIWHNPPVKQDTTGTCWAFSTTSFLESEVKRLTGKEVKLSEMYTVYWEYVEKARRYIREKGKSEFGQGSEQNAVIARVRQYGCVPEEAYTGLIGGRTGHNHTRLFKEMKSYLEYCKQNGYWDEDKAITYIKLILNKYLGEPPTQVTVDGQTMTPKQYATDYLKLPLDDYVALMSTSSVPFWTQGEYKVPDNWWHSKDYYNVPLDDWYRAVRDAVKNGYSLVFGGDVSEPGKVPEEDLAVVPTFDIPAKFINQDARELRFYNHTTTDDHGIHAVGFVHKYGHDWFLIKDSGRSSRVGKLKGYYIFRDDYVKLKMLTVLVHKDGVAKLMAKYAEMHKALANRKQSDTDNP